MSAILDAICPMSVGAPAIVLSLVEPLVAPRAFRPIDIAVSFAGAGGEGVALPLEFTVVGPSPTSFIRHYFRRSAPSVVTFTPREGGLFLVRLREGAHNRLYGTLRLDVAGSVTSPRTPQ